MHFNFSNSLNYLQISKYHFKSDCKIDFNSRGYLITFGLDLRSRSGHALKIMTEGYPPLPGSTVIRAMALNGIFNILLNTVLG